MTTQKYLETLLEGSGHLNKYPLKTNDKSPEYGGFIKIDDKIYRLSGWVKINKGRKSLSLRAILVDENGQINDL